MILDHIGVAVPDLGAAVDQWEMLFGYQRNSEVILNTRQKARVLFLCKQNSLTIKLIEPAAPDSPIFRAARTGGGLHHLCFRCAALQPEIRRLVERGAQLLVAPQPGEAFNGHPIAFLRAVNNLNIELIDTSEKQGWGAQDWARPLENASRQG